jgi:hypothetical protein
VKPTLALECELGKQGMALDGLSDHEFEPVEEIWECEHDEGLFLDSPNGFASKKN